MMGRFSTQYLQQNKLYREACNHFRLKPCGEALNDELPSGVDLTGTGIGTPPSLRSGSGLEESEKKINIRSKGR